MTYSTRRVLLLVGALGLLAGCGSDPQVPSAAAATASTTVSAAVAASVAAVPAVRITDAKGKGVKNVMVRWRITGGGGKVVNDSVRTTGSGDATSGGWTLGTTAGQQTLQATADGIPAVTFTATANAGPLSRLTPVSATDQQATVNTPVPALPAVRAEDQYGNPVSGAAIVFTIVQGNGVLLGAQQSSNELGSAAVGGWTIGTAIGQQIVTATATGANPAVFSVNALAGPAADLLKVVGDIQAGVANINIAVPPGVRVVDSFGNPVGNVPVTFTPGANSGTVTGSTVLSDPANGTAFVGSWRLGTASTQTLVATSTAIPTKSATFTTTVTSSAFNVDIRFVGDASLPVRTAFANAVAKWRQVIVGSIGTITNVNIPAGPAANACSDWSPAVTGTVQNTIIFARIDSIDGPGSPGVGNILGQASPCYVNGSAIPFLGFMEFDSLDVSQLVARGQFEKVVLHEIGHVLGIGTVWNFQRSLLNTSISNDPYYVGSAARAQFAAINTVTYSGNPVPVENTGGTGTVNSHWRTSVMQRELMQGFAVNQVQPLSRITVGSLQDLGYTVNLAAADAFSLTAALRSGFGFDETSGIPYRDLVPDVEIKQRRDDGSIARMPREKR
ncbi:leishmanolysin-related zinc metalloendopeptidase [Gemmatimonas sp.]|uniref:leishmanolysin-related zinc metalloendopeptidase n=1 Tax=Gemmatimonas sp. TaxID=1962908 RepID=UPI00286C8F45|nr:leishmanolysin-related zinc metalloendopeptidase [Gemmatimonas sp.]